MILEAKNITKSYGALRVLNGVSLSVQKGEIISIVGASGAGKSTLLHIIGTLDRPDSGEVSIDGENIFAKKDKALANFRNARLGFIFQFHHLLPEFTALENVCIPAFIGGKKKAESEKRAKELLSLRALMNNPAIVMADEPSGNLDSDNARDLHRLFFDLRDQLGQTFIIVTHNEDLAKMADRMVVMKDGKVI